MRFLTQRSQSAQRRAYKLFAHSVFFVLKEERGNEVFNAKSTKDT